MRGGEVRGHQSPSFMTNICIAYVPLGDAFARDFGGFQVRSRNDEKNTSRESISGIIIKRGGCNLRNSHVGAKPKKKMTTSSFVRTTACLQKATGRVWFTPGKKCSAFWQHGKTPIKILIKSCFLNK